MTKSPSAKSVLQIIATVVLLTLGIIPFAAALWYVIVYGETGFDSILFSLFSNLQGADTDLVGNFLLEGILPAVLTVALFSYLLLVHRPRKKEFVLFRNAGLLPEENKEKAEKKSLSERLKALKNKIIRKPIPVRISYPHIPRWVAVLVSGILCVACLFSGGMMVGLYPWIVDQFHVSSVFEDEFIDPQDASYTFTEKKNLIYIFLESMEITFTDKAHGGGEDYDLIPELRELAEKNVNFSETAGFGGARQITGATWTIGAMVGQTAGTPLKFPLTDWNTYGQKSPVFLPGATSMNDILRENGYYQTLMIGSDAAFGGRDKYFSQHGVDRIYDVYTAREDNIILPNYWAWWGMEDYYLFKYARQELPKIAADKSRPYCFMMLTVDTHHIGGYKCAENCKDIYAENYENVFRCSSEQVSEFVEWIRAQDWYDADNTVIILTGDHFSMDSGYIERNIEKDYQRLVYNCFIGNELQKIPTEHTKNRGFSSFDMMPTVLSCIGCKIEGERLGLGTNLFSDVPTLVEKYGFDELDRQIGLTSNYYNNHILYGDRKKYGEENNK